MDETITAHQILLPEDEPSGTFRFDRVHYDEDTDVLHLESGPECAHSSELTPEGHWLHTCGVENRLVGLDIVDARRRTRLDMKRIDVTIAPGQLLVLDVADLRPVVRGGRFSRTAGLGTGKPIDAADVHIA